MRNVWSDEHRVSGIRVENRLVMCYLFTEPDRFAVAWDALKRLHDDVGDSIFLYQYGVRMLHAPSLLEDTRLLALVMREDDLRATQGLSLARLVDILVDGEAIFVDHPPRLLTNWIADLTEWNDGEWQLPKPPRGVTLVDPSSDRPERTV